ncbi:hypothetical protein C8R44DRAFT_725297 [Mycena epipterygia]|nr:hypothetical protein C8R44DRAFT_725297 [Mycena epipterygia]
MPGSSPHYTEISSPSQHQQELPVKPSKAFPTAEPVWLETLLFTAKTITAGANALPFPYVQGVFETVVFLLETVEKVKRNQESMKELCRDTVDIITVLRDQISAHGDTAALKFKAQCEELEVFLQDVLEEVNQLQIRHRGLGARIKEVIKVNSTRDDISRFQTRIRELRSNFLLRATMDTNFQVQKVLTIMTPNDVAAEVPQLINNCPPPSRIFHGRQTILDQLHQYFTQIRGKQNMFVLHGLGGAGKTQIALKFIEESTSRSSNETIDTGLKAIANIKGVGESSQDALQWLRSKQDEWLLFFDNADDPKIDLNSYFPQCNHGNILITSRNPGLCVYAGSHSPVSDMEEANAVDLLLRSAAQDITDSNKATATQIVKMLYHLPLAIIQAGAFISKSGDLDSYLSLYEQNRARLLSQRPAQSHDDYAWTVYTTWQISFERLSQPAAMFLQLCSFLHHQGISEQILKNAANYRFGPSSPSEEELQMSLEFLSHFLGPTGDWDPFSFMDVTNEVRSYSLINFHLGKKQFSVHPLVHAWTRSTVSDQDSYHRCMVAIVGMSLTNLSDQDTELASPWILPHIDSLMQGDLAVIPDFRHEYAKIYTWGGKLQKAEELQVAILQKWRNLLGEGHPHTLIAMYQLAWTYELQGRTKEAEQLGVVVVEERKNLLGENHPDTLSAMGSLVVTYNSLGKAREAEKLGAMLLEKSRNILGQNNLETLRIMANLASTYIHLGRLQEAEELQVVVLEERRNILGETHPSTLLAMSNLAPIYIIQQKLKEAEQLQLVVVELQRNILGDNHPNTLLSMANLAVIYKDLGKLKEAEELGVMVLKKRRDIFGDNQPDTLASMGTLASIYKTLGRLKKTEELEVVVLEKRRDILGENHPDTLTAMGHLAITHNMLGRFLEAEEILLVLVEKRSNVLGDNHPHTLRAMAHLVSTYNSMERWQEAEKLGVGVLEKYIDLLGDNHPWTLKIVQDLAVTYKKLGKLRKTEDLNIMMIVLILLITQEAFRFKCCCHKVPKSKDNSTNPANLKGTPEALFGVGVILTVAVESACYVDKPLIFWAGMKLAQWLASRSAGRGRGVHAGMTQKSNHLPKKKKGSLGHCPWSGLESPSLLRAMVIREEFVFSVIEMKQITIGYTHTSEVTGNSGESVVQVKGGGIEVTNNCLRICIGNLHKPGDCTVCPRHMLVYLRLPKGDNLPLPQSTSVSLGRLAPSKRTRLIWPFQLQNSLDKSEEERAGDSEERASRDSLLFNLGRQPDYVYFGLPRPESVYPVYRVDTRQTEVNWTEVARQTDPLSTGGLNATLQVGSDGSGESVAEDSFHGLVSFEGEGEERLPKIVFFTIAMTEVDEEGLLVLNTASSMDW